MRLAFSPVDQAFAPFLSCVCLRVVLNKPFTRQLDCFQHRANLFALNVDPEVGNSELYKVLNQP